MNVSLTPEFESFVDEKVKSGSFGSASEVVRAGLRLLQEYDEMRQARLAALRADVRKGREQLERGESESGSKVFAELHKKRKAQRRA
jgi:antitoxin ParD1/3/4